MAYPPDNSDLPVSSGNASSSFNYHPILHNNANQAIRDIRDELGSNPKGSKTSVQARLEDLEVQLSTVSIQGGSATGPAGGDLGGSYPNPTIGTGAITATHIASAYKDGAVGTYSLRTLGTGATQALPGNHSSTTNSRTPNGPAGGDLAGSYPNPTIGAAAVSTAALEDASVTTAKLDAENKWSAGDIKMSATNTVQTGWLACNGAAVSRETYAALFAAIGTSYGEGDGSTTFNVPDGRNKILAGKGASDTLGQTSINKVGVPSVSNTGQPSTNTSGTPSTDTSGATDTNHYHDLSGHNHGYWKTQQSFYTSGGGPSTGYTSWAYGNQSHTHTLGSHTHTLSSHTHNLGDHLHTLPDLVINFLIKY